MYEIPEEKLRNAYKPYDIVTDSDGNVGFISKVSMNTGQPPESEQISYAVGWLTGNVNKVAWFYRSQLTKHCNMFVKIAMESCHSYGDALETEKLMGLGI